MPSEPSLSSLGLSDDEAARRLSRDGPNLLSQAPARSVVGMVWSIVKQPMLLLLLAAASVYAAVGDRGDAVALLLSVMVVASIGVVQTYRTNRVLDSLKALSAPRARVMRSGVVQTIASQDLVVGDYLLVGEGERMACDASLLTVNDLMLDESLLTGESAPVGKHLLMADAQAQGATDGAQTLAHWLYAGSLVVRGDAAALVQAVGANTALGKIGGDLASIVQRPSRLQHELSRIVLRIGVLAVAISLIAAALYAAREGSWVSGMLTGLTLAMAIIPEEFAVVWTVMLALGAWRLAKIGVLTRHMQAIEALGTATVLCVDKTGTLTHNKMALTSLATSDHAVAVDDSTAVDTRFAALLQVAAMACVENGVEPMDLAVLRTAQRWQLPGTAQHALVHRIGVGPQRPWVASLWRASPEGSLRLALKGAPEALLAMCDMDDATRTHVASVAQAMAQQGLRVLGVAQSSEPQPRIDAPTALLWMGLLGFQDPVRDEVPAAMAQCRSAGMRVVMITGDSPATAMAIGHVAGFTLSDAQAVVNGRELDGLSDQALEAVVQQAVIYARVTPGQKLRIVRALQKHGEVVVMTGDGVNDATALRAADIGVAMGKRGTDVAREAASLVLVTDSFASLVDAVRLGRRIFGNLRNAAGYLMAVHVPIVVASLMPLVLGFPPLLLPLHVVLLELIIDPACSLVFEAQADAHDSMLQPPRPASVRLVSMGAVRRALLAGAVAALLVLVAVLVSRWWALDVAWQRLVALVALVVGNVALLTWYRRGAQGLAVRAPNRAFQALLVGLLGALAVVTMSASQVPQLGLPNHPNLQVAGIVLAAGTLLAAALVWRLGRQRAG